MKRFLILLIEIILCYVIQSTMFHYVSLFNVVPNLLLVVVISTAYINGRNYGMIAGFLSGVLLDITFGNVIGLFAFIYLIIGNLSGYSNKIYSEDDYILPIVLVAVGEFLYRFLYYVFEFLLRGKLDFFFYLRRMIVPEMIYTVLVSILLHKIIHILNMKIETE